MRFLFSFFLLVCLVFLGTASAQVLGPGINTSGEFITATVSTLPGGPSTGSVRYVTDGASATDCTTGAGSTSVLCVYDGTDWASVGSAGGVEVDTPQTTFNRIANGDVAISGITEAKPWKWRGASGGATYGADFRVNSLNVFEILPVCADVVNDCDRVLNIPTGKVFDFQINSVSVGKLTGAGVENLTLSAEGTGNVVTIPRRLWFPFAACQNATASLIWDSPTSNAPPAACVTGTNTQKGVADFDATTDESLQMTYMLPSTFTGAIDAKIVGLAAATSGAVGLCVQLVSTADAETDDPAFPAQGAGNCSSDTAKGTTLQLNTATIIGVTATGVAAGELLHIRFSRDADGSAVTDDMTGDWRGVGLELTIREAL